MDQQVKYTNWQINRIQHNNALIENCHGLCGVYIILITAMKLSTP